MSFDGKLRATFDSFHGKRRARARYRRPKLPIERTYCILITPRSGSTWLCHRIARLDVLSCPDEYFIADEFINTLQYNPGRDIYEVFDIVAKKNCTNTGIFGFKMSYFDLEEFEKEAKLLDVMIGDKYFFYLSRRNFVAQAISLYAAVESQIFHVFGDGPKQARPDIAYDDDKIMYWACHILQQEYGIQQWLDTNQVKPVQLHYEELLNDVDGVIARIADQLGVDLTGAPTLDIPQTEKIANGNAADFERAFRRNHSDFCRFWEVVRGTAPSPYTGTTLVAAS
jgi:trehalose 2-sulfotransferase